MRATRNGLDRGMRSGESGRIPMFKIFSSPLDPNTVLTRIKSIVDEEEIDPANPTQFTGSRPIIGRVEADQFRLQHRVNTPWYVWWATPGQWFKPYLRGTVKPQNSGSRLIIEGGTPMLAKVLWALTFIGAASLIALFTWFTYPYNISHNPEHAASLYLVGIIWLNIVAGILILLPITGWLLTRRHLPDMLEQLRQQAQLNEERSLPGHSV
jgi:hypothetical protein